MSKNLQDEIPKLELTSDSKSSKHVWRCFRLLDVRGYCELGLKVANCKLPSHVVRMSRRLAQSIANQSSFAELRSGLGYITLSSVSPAAASDIKRLASFPPATRYPESRLCPYFYQANSLRSENHQLVRSIPCIIFLCISRHVWDY